MNYLFQTIINKRKFRREKRFQFINFLRKIKIVMKVLLSHLESSTLKINFKNQKNFHYKNILFKRNYTISDNKQKKKNNSVN